MDYLREYRKIIYNMTSKIAETSPKIASPTESELPNPISDLGRAMEKQNLMGVDEVRYSIDRVKQVFG